MDRRFARAIVRLGKELFGATSAPEHFGKYSGSEKLSGYSREYALGLSVGLLIMWESANDRPNGAGHQLTINDVMQWVRDLQQQEEARRSTTIQ